MVRARDEAGQSEKPNCRWVFAALDHTLRRTPQPSLFHWENGLKLTTAGLAIDFRRRQPRAFISHAHSDHMARHELAICTPQTAALYQLRLGPRPRSNCPIARRSTGQGCDLTTYPAGHCLGSAMLLAEDQGRTLLYTGDFKLQPSLTAERAELPHADTLVIESTYGHPDYRLPPREECIAEFLALVRQALADEMVPVIQGYVLGKSQEITRLLTDAGIPVLQHKGMYEVSRMYESLGCPLGRFERFRGGRKRVGPSSFRPARCSRACRGRSDSRSPAGPWTAATSIASASIMPFRSPTTPTTTN